MRIALDVSPLKASPEFRRLVVGQGLSMIGGNVLYVAIPIQVWRPEPTAHPVA